ncbi:MAG: amidohydrolase family protein [Planctomycetota bacterium]
MRHSLVRVGLVAMAVAALSSPLSAEDAPATTVYTNGRIYTVDANRSWAEAVAVRGKDIVYVGTDAGAQRLVDAGAEQIDLRGRLVLPGLVESHIHLAGGAGTTSGVVMTMPDTLEDVLAKIKAYAEAHPEKNRGAHGQAPP